jgi:hypothetical protein
MTALLLGAAAALPASSAPGLAAGHSETLKGQGWTLTTVSGQAGYGLTLTGSLTHNGVTYKMLGDWIPAGDAGGDLMRFYGVPFKGVKGLVSVATLYSTCNPNCAAAKTLVLKALGQWVLPGSTAKKVTLSY